MRMTYNKTKRLEVAMLRFFWRFLFLTGRFIRAVPHCIWMERDARRHEWRSPANIDTVPQIIEACWLDYRLALSLAWRCRHRARKERLKRRIFAASRAGKLAEKERLWNIYRNLK